MTHHEAATMIPDHSRNEGASLHRWGVGVLAVLLLATTATAQEICDNGLDDDGNGLVDLNDVAACPCLLLPPPTNFISNGSFEDHGCCPPAPGSSPSPTINCATGWVSPITSCSPDYYNPCGYYPPVVPPAPSGNSVMGMVFHTWPGGASYEFVAQCLNTPLLAGQSYQMGFNVAAVRLQFGFIGTLPINFGPSDLAIYGLDTCPNFPYTFYDPVWGNPMPSQYCPTELGWTEIGRVTYTPSNNWQEVNISFSPSFNTGAIMFGPACPIPQDYNMWGSSEPYFFFDDMSIVLAEVAITRTGHPCTNDLVFTATPFDAPPNSYQWYLNGVALVGQTSDTLFASALGLAEGTYTMRMIRADGSCVMVEKEVEVEYPQPLVQAVPPSGCAPLNTVLTDLTSPALVGSLLWDLGDGSTASTGTVAYTYTDPGIYDVGLTITSPEGCVSDTVFVGLIEVFPVPAASFTADTLMGCPGLEVLFTNTSQPGTGLDCVWNLGDGGVLPDCSGPHTYTTPGLYDVRLSVSTAAGCSADTLVVGLIEILPVPEPAFSIEPSNGCVPLVVRFENLTPDASSQASSWDLGNGSTSSSTNAITTYTDPGAYSVSLTMTNSIGCSAVLAYADTIQAYGLPVVVFSVLPDSGCAPLHVEFINDTDPLMVGSCAWDFGDGSSSGSCNTAHTYTDPGSYTVSLYVSSPANCAGDTTVYHLIHVYPSPTAHFTVDPQPAYLDATDLEFTDGSSSDVVGWDWSFPLGVPPSSTAPSPSVAYPSGESGAYPATLIVTNDFGCVDTATVVVQVNGIFSVYVPNTFTPNGDGYNDVFVPVIRDATLHDYLFLVFDRWGQEVFSSTSIGEGWDGRVNGAEPKTDVYAWRIKVRSDVDALMREYMGHVTVLR